MGTSKVKFTNLNFIIESESTPVKPPSIGMQGIMNLEISSEESLDFITTMETQIAPIEIGGEVELDVKDGSGIWKNPFGIPCLGIRNLKGGISMSPATPSIISELVLGGDIMIAKKV